MNKRKLIWLWLFMLSFLSCLAASAFAYTAIAAVSNTGNSVATSVYVGPNNDLQYVADTIDGGYLGPDSFGLKSDGGFYLLDTANNEVLSYSANGKKEGDVSFGNLSVTRIYTGPNDALYALDESKAVVGVVYQQPSVNNSVANEVYQQPSTSGSVSDQAYQASSSASVASTVYQASNSTSSVASDVYALATYKIQGLRLEPLVDFGVTSSGQPYVVLYDKPGCTTYLLNLANSVATVSKSLDGYLAPDGKIFKSTLIKDAGHEIGHDCDVSIYNQSGSLEKEITVTSNDWVVGARYLGESGGFTYIQTRVTAKSETMLKPHNFQNRYGHLSSADVQSIVWTEAERNQTTSSTRTAI